MLSTKEKEFRKLIIKELVSANSNYSKKAKSIVKISDIDKFITSLDIYRKESKEEILKEYYNELLTSYIALLACTNLGVGLTLSAKSKVKLFPDNFISGEKYPEPNLAFGAIFTLIANEILSIIRLILDGMEFPARPLIRSLNELCMLSVVLLLDENKRKVYYLPQSFKEARDAWHKDFTPSKLNNTIIKFKNNYDVKEQIFFEEYFECNKHAQELYSQSAHSSALNSSVGAYSSYIKDDDKMVYAILGYASNSSQNTLFYMSEFVFYTLAIFRMIIEKQLNLSFPSKDEFKKFLVLEDTMASCLYHICK